VALLKEADGLEPQAFLRMLERQNRAVVEADLVAFFGPRNEVYLRHYRRLVEDGWPQFSWHWPCFLTGGFGWAFYRRAWSSGAGIVGLLALAALLNVLLCVLFLLLMTLQAKSMYVQQGLKWIQRAEKVGLVGEARRSFLAKAGGTSLVAGVLAGPWFAVLTVPWVALSIIAAGQYVIPKFNSQPVIPTISRH
jgi:hypothetical protein